MNGRLFKVMALGVITALITSLGLFVPASADPVLCNTNQAGSKIAPLTVEQCAQGWHRDYFGAVDGAGYWREGTVDWFPEQNAGLHFCFYNDFVVTSTLTAYVNDIWVDIKMDGNVDVPFSGTTQCRFIPALPSKTGQVTWGIAASSQYLWGTPYERWWSRGGTLSVSLSTPSLAQGGARNPGPGASPLAATKTCNDQGLVAKHVQKRLKPRRWRCMPPPAACKKAVALKQAGKASLARKMTRRCAVTLRRWRR